MKMKRGVGILLFSLLWHFSFAQFKRADFSLIDWKTRNIDAPSLDSVAIKLTQGYSTELEKVRSIFRWITEHIEYKVPPRVSARYHYIKRWEDTTMEWRAGEEMTAWATFQKRTAFCEGYAKLFKTLCTYAGIKAQVVTGYARTNSGGKFISNHSWNAVYIDSNWYLLDVTWASGYISDRTDEFVQAYDDFYFLTSPHQLIRTHYPEDIRWALLNDVPEVKEFQKMPFRHSNFVKYSIASYFPLNGIIEAFVGDTLHFEIVTSNKERDGRIGSNPFFDSTVLSHPAAAFVQPSSVMNKKTVYEFVVNSTSTQWLHLLYNKDIVLQYRLAVRNKPKDIAFSLYTP